MAMGRPVGELLASMTSREMAEWEAYDKIEPIGAIRADIHAALIAREVANNNPYRRKPTQLADFLPFQEKQIPTQTGLIGKLNGLRKAALSMVGVKRG